MTNRMIGALVGLLVVFASAKASGATFKVGPDQTYKSLRTLSLSPDLKDGDVIEVDGSAEYCGDVATWTQNDLTIRGIGGTRPHLKACGKSERGKAIWVVIGSNFTVENFEFSGAEVDSRNGAGIRAEGGGTMLVRNCYFHDNQNGILGGGAPESDLSPENERVDDVLIVEHSIFERNGAGDGKSHNLYISARVDNLIFRYNFSHGARVGHNLKSRAGTNYILYNQFRDGEGGNASFQVDLPNGGLSYVIGNVMQQGPKAENSTLLAYSNEASESPHPVQEIYVINNTFANTRPEGAKFIRLSPRKGKTTLALVRNNVFYGPGIPWPESDEVRVVAEYNHVEERLANGPRFSSPDDFDYRPTPGSPLIDAGWNPGTARGYDLTPAFQYVEDAKTQPRHVIERIDIGAFEFPQATPKR